MEDMRVNFKLNKPPFWEVKCIPLVIGVTWGSVTRVNDPPIFFLRKNSFRVHTVEEG